MLLALVSLALADSTPTAAWFTPGDNPLPIITLDRDRLPDATRVRMRASIDDSGRVTRFTKTRPAADKVYVPLDADHNGVLTIRLELLDADGTVIYVPKLPKVTVHEGVLSAP